MPTIALVDDDRDILELITMMLESEGYHVASYTDGAAALGDFKTSSPDLAILDIKMPRMDGLELLRRLREWSDIPVMFLTSMVDEIDELVGFKLGADDFVRKPFSQRLLVERVKALLRRRALKHARSESEPDAKILKRGQLRMDPERHICTWKGKQVPLTATEFLLLQALANRPGAVRSRDALMDAAHDDETRVNERTVDAYIKRLRKKLTALDETFDMIETVYGVGYRFKET